MVPFNNPISQRVLPKRHEGSQMNSPRERDAQGKQWKMSRTTDSQTGTLTVSINRMQNELGKLRRRTWGAASVASTGGIQFKGEYNNGVYKKQNMVIFTPDGQSPGTYISLKDVPAGQSPDVGFPYWVALPTSPSGVWA